MQPSCAFARGAASGRPLYWRFALAPGILVFPFLIPVLVWSQRGGRNHRWKSADPFTSGMSIRSPGRGAPWSEMRPAPKEASSTDQRSTQQLHTIQIASPLSATYSTSSSHNSQQAWHTVVSPPAFSSSPVLHTRPMTAGANSYSSGGSVDRTWLPSYALLSEVPPSVSSSDTTAAPLVVPHSSIDVPPDNTVPVNRFNAAPAFQRSSVSSSSQGRTFSTPQTRLSESSSIPVTSSAEHTQGVYSAYRNPTTSAHRPDGRPATNVLLNTSSPSSSGGMLVQSTFLPTSFNSRNSAGTNNRVSSTSSTFHAFPVTSTVTPWNSGVQQDGGVSWNATGDSVGGRSTPSAFQPSFSDISTSERQRTEADPQSMATRAHQRPPVASSASSARSSGSARSPQSVTARNEQPAPVPNAGTYAAHSGFESPRAGHNERQSVMSSRISTNTESRNSATPSTQLTAAVGDRGDSTFVEQAASWRLPRNITASASLEEETTSSVWLARDNLISYGDNTTLPDGGNSGSLQPPSLPQWSAGSNTLSRSFLQNENNGGPRDNPLKDDLPQAYGDDRVSRPSEQRNEDSPSHLVSDSPTGSAEAATSRSKPPAHPCPQPRGERNAFPPPDNFFEDSCAVLDDPHRVGDPAEPVSVPLLTEQLPSVSEQSGAALPQGEFRSGFTDTGATYYSTNSDTSVDSSTLTAEANELAHPATQGNEAETARPEDELNFTPLVRQHLQDKKEGSVGGAVQHDTAEMMRSDQAPFVAGENETGQRARNIATQDDEGSSSDESKEGPQACHVLAGYIPAEALASSSAGAEVNELRNNGDEPLYGDLSDYMKDAEDPFLKSLSALEKEEDTVATLSVTTTSTATTQTYPPFYNPYNDNLDVDDIPDSPYHNYKWAVDPFPSTYSTHSRLENYESEFNNRYYHEERTAPNITWEEYTRRRKEVDDARKREAELQNEGSIGLIESSDSLFQGLIGYPNRGRMSRLPV